MADEIKPPQAVQPTPVAPVTKESVPPVAPKPTPAAQPVAAAPLTAPLKTPLTAPSPTPLAAPTAEKTFAVAPKEEPSKTKLLDSLLNKSKDGSTPATGNAFTNLFGGLKKPTPPAAAPAPAPSTATPTIASLAAKAHSLADMLGPKPVFSKAKYAEGEREKTHTAKNVFTGTLLLAVVVYGFFYTQLTSTFTLFGPNPAAQFERSNAELVKTQTDLNLVRLRTARLWLDGINAQADPFLTQRTIAASPLSTDIQKQLAQEKVDESALAIKNSLKEVQKIFTQPLGIDVFSTEPIDVAAREAQFEAQLKESLSSQRATLSRESKQNAEQIRLLDNVSNLVTNRTFRGLIRSQSIDELSSDELAALLSRIRSEAVDEIAMIEKVKAQRLDWGKIIEDIHTVVRKADVYYGQGLFKTVGGFVFSSYRFDFKTGRVAISGLTKTSDSKTFSFIAKLIDSIEKSPKFKDIDFRSFAKTRDENGDFSSGINLDFALQTGTDERDTIQPPTGGK